MSQVTYSNPSTIGKPLGSYSHVSRAGDLVVVAGQVGADPEGKVAEEFAEQVRLTFGNLQSALESEGLGLSNVLQFTTYLISAEDISPFYEARNKFFPSLFPSGQYPPNTLLVIDRLVYPELRVEIQAMAHA